MTFRHRYSLNFALALHPSARPAKRYHFVLYSYYTTRFLFASKKCSDEQKSDPWPPAIQHEVRPPILQLYQIPL